MSDTRTPRADQFSRNRLPMEFSSPEDYRDALRFARELERELSEERSKTDAYVAALGKVERELALTQTKLFDAQAAAASIGGDLAEARELVGEAVPAVKGELIMGNAPAQAAWRNGWLARARKIVAAIGRGELCAAETTAKIDTEDSGKWRRCDLPAEHSGAHKTTYCGRDYCWLNAASGREALGKEGT